MTDEIIEMAKEIAAQYIKAERYQTWTHDYMMQRLMDLVAAEREACAKLIEAEIGMNPTWQKHLAAKLRGES